MNQAMRCKSLFFFALITVFTLALAHANERHFGYAYETATLPVGAKEVELWTTSSMGRDQYYSKLKHRVEFEFGLAKYVMGAFYLNWSNITAYEGGELVTHPGWDGISAEVKTQLTDPSTSPIGSALYLELGYGTDEVGVEGKILLDKKHGDWLFAANIVGEGEWVPELRRRTATDREVEWLTEEAVFEFNLAAAYDFGHGLSAGVEFLNQEVYTQENDTWDLSTATFHLGPTLTYASKSWWLNLTILPQLPAAKSEGESSLDLQDHERLQTRLLLSFHL